MVSFPKFEFLLKNPDFVIGHKYCQLICLKGTNPYFVYFQENAF